MYPLHYQHITLFHSDSRAFHSAFAGGEVEFRKSDLLAFEQLVEVVVEHFEIEGIHALEVIFSLFVLRGEFPVHKVIVHAYDNRVQAQNLHLQGNSLGCSGFA